jgi:hypothetical protein
MYISKTSLDHHLDNVKILLAGRGMNTLEKRKYPRFGSHNLVFYVCFDEENHMTSGGMGRTLNVSEGGILLETHTPINLHPSVSLTIGLEDELMDIKGKVTFSKKRADGKFENGIKFLEGDEKKLRFLKQFIIIFTGESDRL